MLTLCCGVDMIRRFQVHDLTLPFKLGLGASPHVIHQLVRDGMQISYARRSPLLPTFGT